MNVLHIRFLPVCGGHDFLSHKAHPFVFLHIQTHTLIANRTFASPRTTYVPHSTSADIYTLYNVLTVYSRHEYAYTAFTPLSIFVKVAAAVRGNCRLSTWLCGSCWHVLSCWICICACFTPSIFHPQRWLAAHMQQ